MARRVILFLVAFSVPIYFGIKLTYLLPASSSSSAELVDSLFPGSAVIPGFAKSFKIKDSAALQPETGKDFLLLLWLKLHKLPKIGSRMILISKYDAVSKERNGYALGLMRAEEGFRPIVYWTSAKDGARWYTFSEVPIEIDTWFMLSVISYQDRLGVHIGTRKDEQAELKLAGGFDFGATSSAISNIDLTFIPLQETSLKGSIGPFAIISKVDLWRDLKDTLKEIVAEPLEVGSMFEEEELKAWITDYRGSLKLLELNKGKGGG